MRTMLAALLVLWAGCSNRRLDVVTASAKMCLGQAGHYQMEGLGRGVVAVKVAGGVYIGWRMQGCEYDPQNPGGV